MADGSSRRDPGALMTVAMLVLSPLHDLLVPRILAEEKMSDGWLVFRRSPGSTAPASSAVNATDK